MLDFKTDALINYSLKLAKIHRAALPNAVRFTLTDSAKDVKFRTLGKHANKQFDVKKATFFRAFSRFDPAKGNNISKMKSTAGMIHKSGKSVASTEIGQQQIAGTVLNKSYMAIEKGRTGRGLANAAYKKARKIKPIIAEKGKKFFPNAKKAKESNRPLLVKKNRKGYLVKVNKIRKVKGSKKREVVTTILGGYREDRKINLKKIKPFLNNAALESGKLLNSNFIKNANKQVARFTR